MADAARAALAALALSLTSLPIAAPAAAQANAAVWVDHRPPRLVAIPDASPLRSDVDPRDLAAVEGVLNALIGAQGSEPARLDGLAIIEASQPEGRTRIGSVSFAPIPAARARRLLASCRANGDFQLPRQADAPGRAVFGFFWDCPNRPSLPPVVTVVKLADHRATAIYVHSDGPAWRPTTFRGGIFDQMRSTRLPDGAAIFLPGLAAATPPAPARLAAIDAYLASVRAGRPAPEVAVTSQVSQATMDDLRRAVTACTRDSVHAIEPAVVRIGWLCDGRLAWLALFRFAGDRPSEAQVERAVVPGVVRPPAPPGH